ncbi:MAG: hypothetical protein QNI95_03070, partial [Desulfobacterales bacterium]|nr:hypothetical protein [Desulfobacterales bacterium]
TRHFSFSAIVLLTFNTWCPQINQKIADFRTDGISCLWSGEGKRAYKICVILYHPLADLIAP